MTGPAPRTVRGYPALLWEHSIDVAEGRSLVVSCDTRGAACRDLAMKNTETAADFAVADLLSR